MKKLLLCLTLCPLLFACRKAQPHGAADQWKDYRKAYELQRQGKDSAYYYYNRAASSSRDSLAVAMAYNNMAVIQADAGDYFGAQESLLMSLKSLEEQNPAHRTCLGNDYNELGMTSSALKDYTAAIAFYDRAIAFTDDIPGKLVMVNNKANALRDKKDYAGALPLYTEALRYTGTKGTDYTRALTNKVITRWLQTPRYHAAPELLKALEIRKRENDLWGQNSSYAHLSDYYYSRRPDSALFYAKAMYALSRRLNSADDRLEALEKLVGLSPAQDHQLYFALYRKLGDSLQTARNAAKNQFALVRYNVEKQKSENLSLQKDNTDKRYQLLVRNGLLAGLVALSAGGAVLGFVLYRKKQQRLRLEAQHSIRENQLKTAKRVHDVLANGLYRVMSAVENGEGLDKDALLDQMEELYERTRDISYDFPLSGEGSFAERIKQMLLSFATAKTRVVIAGNEDAFWQKAGPQGSYELEQVLLELMVNMKKHSRAGNVVVRLGDEGNQLTVFYKDDGVGFSKDVRYQNGLNSTGNRIKEMRGRLIFDSKPGEGLEIRIAVPVI